MGSTGRHAPDNRPMGRIGGGDLPTITVDPHNERVVYSCSTVFWRTDDAGLTWSAVRGAPGGDDYQKSWVNPNNSDIILLVSDQGGFGESRAILEQLVYATDGGDVSRNGGQFVSLPTVQRAAGFRFGLRGKPRDGWRNYVS